MALDTMTADIALADMAAIARLTREVTVKAKHFGFFSTTGSEHTLLLTHSRCRSKLELRFVKSLWIKRLTLDATFAGQLDRTGRA